MRAAIVDLDEKRLIEVDGMTLKGECNRCGKCCVRLKCDCPHLIHETIDGKPLTRCAINFVKPFGCAMYPMPEDKTPDGCGYWWEKK